MPLIDPTGTIRPDGWRLPGVEGDGPALVTLADLLAGARSTPLGVLVGPETNPTTLAPYLSDLALIAISFPKFRDGRGFTIARSLRERLGYQGEIRAVGHILPDQALFLAQCGFTTILTPPEHPPEQWAGAAGSEKRPLVNRLLGRGVAG